MLQYLVTSKVRRRLLSLLWGAGKRGSATELAHLAGVAFAGAHTELKAMQRAHLAVSRRESGKEVYAANLDHPDAATLQALASAGPHRTAPASKEDELLRRRLVALGAPLQGIEPLAVAPPDRMPTLFKGALLARRDPTVARTLPLCFWNLREALDVPALVALAARAEDKHALGFFLELTGALGGERRLRRAAQSLRDRRMTAVRDFFQSQRRSAVRNFPLAKKWGFQMNMDLDSFRSLFDKFVTR